MKKTIENKNFDQERALYGERNASVSNCTFSGPADGESAFKECGNIAVENCYFNLRYPFWHDHVVSISASEMTENCRAALWYSDHVYINDTKMHGIKALRECKDVSISNCDIISPEFGWSSSSVSIESTKAESEYFLMRASDVRIKNLEFKGKYSFQYIDNMTIEDSYLDTKDAFWHTRNVTVINSTLKGEYLAWYSDGLTLINCKIIGTQPLCYCKNLRLVDCTMVDTDLSFEKSDVDAYIIGDIESVKNPLSGVIEADSIGSIILDDESAKARIVTH